MLTGAVIAAANQVVDWFLLPDSDLQLESDAAPLSPRGWLLSGRPVEAVVTLARDLTRA